MDKRLTNKNKENTIYLSEDEARALGIVEGDTQSIFIDGKKVDLLFVDEHEIFDATTEEKRILSNALNLRKRELAEKLGVVDPSTRTTSLIPYGKIEDDTPDFDTLQVSTKGTGFFGTIKTLFAKKVKPYSEQAPDLLERSKYRNRTDIFTNEEIEIIQEVISRAQGSNRSNMMAYDYYDDVSTPKTKKTNVKKSSAKKNIKNAKGHEISTLNAKKATRNLNTNKVTSPKKKQARRAARRSKK